MIELANLGIQALGFLSLLAVVWRAGRVATTLEHAVELLKDHETRLRAIERGS